MDGRDILSYLVRIVIASAAMSAVAHLSWRFMETAFAGAGIGHRLVNVMVPIALAAATFAVAAKLLRIDETEKLYQAIVRKFRRAG